MEKIVVALNPGQININVIDFACYIAGQTRSSLTGIFLENDERELVPIARHWRELQTEIMDEPAILEKRSAIKLNEDNRLLFEEACRKRGVRTASHYSSGEPFAEIVTESRFADLLIVDPEILFGDRTEASLRYFIKNVLTKSECPVVIAPYAFYGIDEILFFYDGTASSTFAIKQFAYLFPELTDLRITVVQVGDRGDAPFIEKKKLGEFLQMHFSGIGFRVLEGKTGDELLAYLQDKKNIFVVMGAFGRNNPLSYFSQSNEALQLKAVNLPLFFATGPWH